MPEACGVPILSSTDCVELTETAETLADLGIDIKGETTLVRVMFEGRWTLKAIARYSRDPSASITAAVGAPIYPRAKICLNENELLSVFRTVSGTLNICVEQYKTVQLCDFQAQYRSALAQLLPRGFAWEAKSIPGSVLYRLLNVVAKMASDLHCRALALENEFFASTCKELCNNWADESFDNDLSLCLQGISLSKAQEVQAIVAKVIGSGATTIADYEEIAEALGLSVTITEDFMNNKIIFDIIGANVEPMTTCDLICARFTDGPDMNFILAFRCIMEKIRRLGINFEFRIDGAC
jgi:uncharacterized protein YmfQ (DUF2313 family)